MRRIRGLFLWMMLAVFAFGQGAALAACPMRLAAIAQPAAEAPPCHPQPAPAGAETGKDAPDHKTPQHKSPEHKSLVGCLCAVACKGVATPAPLAAVDPPTAPRAAAPARRESAWVDALHSLDPPVPRAQG